MTSKIYKNIMKKVHISFANEEYYKSLDLLEQTSLEIGEVDQFIRYTQEWLKTTDFWTKNQYVLNQKRGAGYWLYKPFVILETFKDPNIKEGDIVLWSDAGVRVDGSLNPLFKVFEQRPEVDRIIFRVPWVGVNHVAKMWTKRDCFVLMNCDEPKYWNAPMTNGAISLWKKNEKNIEILAEWLRYCRDSRTITDDPNICGMPNFQEFKEHRHDQSILTNLSVKYNFELFRDPTQWGNKETFLFENSKWGQLFWHHRNFKHME
jgi:hypothetical protein